MGYPPLFFKIPPSVLLLGKMYMKTVWYPNYVKGDVGTPLLFMLIVKEKIIYTNKFLVFREFP